MLVVSDTSPLSNLAIIGRLGLLREQFQAVRMPAAVARELSALPFPHARLALADALRAGWLVEEAVPLPAPSPENLVGLDAGETETIRLALALQADRILMDEKEGRQRAAALSLRTVGIIGVLIVAKQAGRFDSLAAEIVRLRREAGFFVDRTLETRVLEIVGE
jgi:predicted nucleic acid-binding protein